MEQSSEKVFQNLSLTPLETLDGRMESVKKSCLFGNLCGHSAGQPIPYLNHNFAGVDFNG